MKRDSLKNMVTEGFFQGAEVRQGRIQSFAFVLSVCVCILLAIIFSASRLPAVSESDVIKLDEKINPNEAAVSSLVRLPGIGVSRAEAIAAYREDIRREGQDMAFRDSDDLQKVKGIGPKTAQGIGEWLKFE